MYIVKDGRVKVSRLLPNGKERILAFRETGEYFGEMSLLDGGTSAATVTATILFTTQRDFQKLLSNASINTALLRMLCTRCREAWSQIEVLTFHNATPGFEPRSTTCRKRKVCTPRTAPGSILNSPTKSWPT